MKNNFYLILFSCFIAFNASAKKVKFAVDFGTDSASIHGVHIASDFQTYLGLSTNWLYDSTELFNVAGTGIYTLVVDIPAFQKYEFAYVNGTFDYETEYIPLESQVQFGNLAWRFVYIDSLAPDTTELPAIRFAHNAPAGKKLLRFKVNMQNEMVSANGVHLIGDFQGQNPAITRMCPLGNVYHYLAYFDSATSTTVNYSFVNGNTLADEEVKDTTCTNPNLQRSFTFLADKEMDTICYRQCSNCKTPAAIDDIDNNYQVNITPNPSSQNLSILFGNEMNNCKIKITTIQGKIIFEHHLNAPKKFTLNNSLAKGIYFVEIIDENNFRKVMQYVQQ